MLVREAGKRDVGLLRNRQSIKDGAVAVGRVGTKQVCVYGIRTLRSMIGTSGGLRRGQRNGSRCFVVARGCSGAGGDACAGLGRRPFS